MQISDTGFDFADIVDEAVDRSGGQTATAADVLRVRRGLRLLTEAWNAEGYNLWRVMSSSVVIPAGSGVPHITLPRNVDDVIQCNSRRWDGSGGFPNAEMPMIRISEAQYAILTTKTTAGRPSQYCLRRSDPPELLVFPIGDEGFGWELTYTYVERPARFERYDSVSDREVPGRWLGALVAGLALDLAKKRPPFNEELIARLQRDYDAAASLAQMGDRGRQRFRYRIS